jgi:ribonucleoside-diphosphate reductase alpha chain
MAVHRSAFICQSQSLNLFIEDPNIGKLSSMYMYAWKQGIKTTYYLRSRAKTAIKKTTVEAVSETQAVSCSLENPASCEACQ